MGRPEKPIVTTNRELRALAEWLRAQRRRAGKNYRELAVRAGLHPTTLQRAASGERVPKLSAVRAYARACDASPEDAKLLWIRARCEETRAERGGKTLPAPPPRLIRDFADLSAGLRDLYERAGSPTLRTLEKRAGGYGALPRSTAQRIVNRQAMPHSQDQFEAFLRACEVPDADRPEWREAWGRAWRLEKQADVAIVPLASNYEKAPERREARSQVEQLTQLARSHYEQRELFAQRTPVSRRRRRRGARARVEAGTLF